MSDSLIPDDDGEKKGLEKLLANGSVNVQYDKEKNGTELVARVLNSGIVEERGDPKEQGEAKEIARIVHKIKDSEGQEKELTTVIYKVDSDEE